MKQLSYWSASWMSDSSKVPPLLFACQSTPKSQLCSKILKLGCIRVFSLVQTGGICDAFVSCLLTYRQLPSSCLIFKLNITMRHALPSFLWWKGGITNLVFRIIPPRLLEQSHHSVSAALTLSQLCRKKTPISLSLPPLPFFPLSLSLSLSQPPSSSSLLSPLSWSRQLQQRSVCLHWRSSVRLWADWILSHVNPTEQVLNEGGDEDRREGNHKDAGGGELQTPPPPPSPSSVFFFFFFTSYYSSSS